MNKNEHGGDIYAGLRISADFSVNTNPLGMPEAVKRSIIDNIALFERYPDPYCRELRSALSASEGVSADWILCGNGAADLIFRLCMAAQPKLALVCAPTFAEYEKAVGLAGGAVRYHRLCEADGFALTDRVLADISHDIDIFFLCNPNNPTGRLVDEQLMLKIAARCRELDVTLIVDECFLPFTRGNSVMRFFSDCENIVVLRAFTKLYSMAGLRLGYMITPNASLFAKTRDFSQHWSVSVPAQVAGAAALRVEGWACNSALYIAKQRERLAASLRETGVTVYDSDANYLLCKSDTDVYSLLLERGILVRSCANFEVLDARYFRVAVKNRDENELLIAAIREAIHG